MIRPASDWHPMRNVLVRSHAAANAMRFHGTEADSTQPLVLSGPLTDEGDSLGWTTRRYPRTLDEAMLAARHATMHSLVDADSAWPESAEYADPIQKFEHALDWLDRWSVWASLAVLACIVALVCAWIKS